jgi:hypothetical protein
MREEVSHRTSVHAQPLLPRNSRPSGRRALWAAIIGMALWLIVAATARSQPDPIQRPAVSPIAPAELAALWESQRSEIATAEMRFRCFNGSLENPANSPEHVQQLLSEHDLVAHPEQLDACLLDLAGRPFSVAQPWEDMALTVSGRRRRFEDAFTTFVCDGNVEAAFTPSNRQVDLYPVGKSVIHHYDLADVRWIPSSRVSAESWEFLHLAGDDAVFHVPPLKNGTGSTIVTAVDSATGIITHKITRHADGTPAIETYQQGLELHSSGIVFPRLRVDLQYRQGVARTARVILVASARFNEPVDDAVFELPLAQGAKVIDYRSPEKAAYIAAKPVADALTLAVHRLASPALPPLRVPASAAPPFGRTLLIVAHVVALLAGGVLIWRRRKTSSPRRR